VGAARQCEGANKNNTFQFFFLSAELTKSKLSSANVKYLPAIKAVTAVYSVPD